MIDAVGPILRALHAGGGLLLFGTLLCLAMLHAGAPAWRRRWQRIALWSAVVTAVLSLGVLGLQIASVPQAATRMQTGLRLLTESRLGHIWIAREVVLFGCAIALGIGSSVSASLLAGVYLALAPLSGHAGAAEPAWPVVSINALHLLAVGGWWGALPALASRMLAASREDPVSPAQALGRFSALALPLMIVILASGIWLAAVHVERWAALFGTRYGYLLLCKVVLLAAVLSLAAKLRLKLLPALHTASASSMTARVAHLVIAEAAIAALIVALAAQLGQSIPAQHDTVLWWLPFRFSVDATWDTRGVPAQVVGGTLLCVAGIAAIAAVITGRWRRSWMWLVGAVATAIGGVLALHALAVDAYPDTYRRPSVPYQTVSVAQGADLFARHCTGCHGKSARGDGPLASRLPLAPADLTQPHTALHTAGDLFWWLTRGKPPGVMPGFAQTLGEDERWDLINYLRTLSAGYQARIVTDRVVPGRPWLPAIDFSFTTRGGTGGSLKDYRERSAVLLVFFSLPGSTARITALAQVADRLHSAGAEILAVPIADADVSSDTLTIIEDGAPEAARSYALLRRTLAQPDSSNEQPMPQHMEFLVDRYGYLRARWMPSEGAGWDNLERLLEQVTVLAHEPRIKPAPDDHVH